MVVLAPGAQPFANYQLTRCLGGGGYGEVWEAVAPGGFRIAMKFLRAERGKAAAELNILQRIKEIRHPHLLDVQFATQLDDTIVVGMPLCEESLAQRLEKCQAAGLPGIPRDELIRYMHEAAEAIDFLNQPHPVPGGAAVRIQHRDVKPQNMFLAGGSLRLADFGLARLCQHTVTAAPAAMSLPFAPPESFQNKVALTSDQYSLAVAYCQLRCGRLPFFGNPAAIMHGHLHGQPDLSQIAEAERPVLLRALGKDPAQRWPNCAAFVAALATAASTAAATLVPDCQSFGDWPESLLMGSTPPPPALVGYVSPAAPVSTEHAVHDVAAIVEEPRQPRRRWPAFLIGLIFGAVLAVPAVAYAGTELMGWPAFWDYWADVEEPSPRPSELPKTPLAGSSQAKSTEFGTGLEKLQVDLANANEELIKLRKSDEDWAEKWMVAQNSGGAVDKAMKAIQLQAQADKERLEGDVKQALQKANAASQELTKSKASFKKLQADLRAAADELEREIEQRKKVEADFKKAADVGKEYFAVVSIANRTKDPMTFEIRWQNNLGKWSEWGKEKLTNGFKNVYWHKGGIWCQVRFHNKENQVTRDPRFNVVLSDKNPEYDDGRFYYFEKDGNAIKFFRE